MGKSASFGAKFSEERAISDIVSRISGIETVSSTGADAIAACISTGVSFTISFGASFGVSFVSSPQQGFLVVGWHSHDAKRARIAKIMMI